MCEGRGNCLKYLTREWNRKEGRGDKDFKKGGKLGEGVEVLRRGGGGGTGTSLRTMVKYMRDIRVLVHLPYLSVHGIFP